MNCNIETQVVFCCLCCRKIQRLCKARAEAKFTWIMPSRRQFSCKRVQSRTCSGYAERSRIFVQASAIELAHIAERSRKSQRKCQEKVHLYETFAHVLLYAIFPPKNPAYPSLTPYLLLYKCVASVWFAGPTLH